MVKKILLVDDESDFTELVGTLLRFHDYQVDAYNESLNIDLHLKEVKYDVVVTDLMMPGDDGFKVLGHIRAIPDYYETPVIVLSAKILSDEERKIILQHGAQFMMKPFDPQDLVEKIRLLTVSKP